MDSSQDFGGRVTSNNLMGLVLGNVVQAGCIHINCQFLSATSAAVSQVSNVPARNPHFTGRSNTLKQLRMAMHASSAVTVQSLRGLGGVGKTQLAIEYAHRYASDFDIVWWIPAELAAAIPYHLAELGEMLGISCHSDSMVTVRRVLAALRRCKRWLLVFDNAEDPSALHEFLPSGNGNGHVLITTRRGGFAALGFVLEVDVLKRSDSVVLIRHRIPSATEELASQLATLLGDLPLALEQALSYLDITGLAVDSYIALLTTHMTEMIGHGRAVGHNATLATLWDLSLTALGEQSPAAVQLLDVLAWFAPEPIPLALFTRHPEILLQPLAETAADVVAFNATVGALVDRFLVRRSTDRITIAHRLLQQSLRRRHGATNRSYVTAHELLIAELLTGSEEPLKWRCLLPHVLAICETMHVEAPYLVTDSARLLSQAGDYLSRDGGRPADAELLYEKALTIAESLYEFDNPALMPYLRRVGHMRWPICRVGESRLLLERALKIAERVYGPNHLNVVDALHSLGNFLHNTGRHSNGVEVDQRALSIVEAIHGPNHPDVAKYLTILGWGLCNSGQAEAAVTLYQRAIRITESTIGRRNDQIVNHLMNLGAALIALGRLDDAVVALTEMAETHEELHGSTRPEIIHHWTTLGNILADTGKWGRATSLQEQALKLAITLFGDNHPETAAAMRHLACTLLRTSHPAEAKLLLEHAYAIDEIAYTAHHFLPAIDLVNIGHALCALDRPKEALLLYKTAATVAEDSNCTFRATHLNNIAYAFVKMGQTEEACIRQKRALMYIESVFKPYHPATAIYLSNLGVIAEMRGRRDEAMFLFNTVSDIIATLYNPDRPPPAIQLNILGYGMSADRRPLDFTAHIRRGAST